MKKFISMLVLALTAAGCSSPPVVAYGGAPLEERIVARGTGKFAVEHSPGLEKTVTAELGDTMIARRYSLATPAIRLMSDLDHTTSNIGMPVRLYVEKGVLKKVGQDANGVYFSSENLYRTYPTLNSRAKEPGGVYVPSASTDAPLIFWSPRSPDKAYVDRIATAVALGSAADVIEVSADNQKKELIYTGVSKNVISVLYREYQNDMARPAFSQELKYDLGEGQVIGFKGARFEVVKATNLGITYRVLRHLD